MTESDGSRLFHLVACVYPLCCKILSVLHSVAGADLLQSRCTRRNGVIEAANDSLLHTEWCAPRVAQAGSETRSLCSRFVSGLFRGCSGMRELSELPTRIFSFPHARMAREVSIAITRFCLNGTCPTDRQCAKMMFVL